jgi:CheY-like chemotaxis protein
MAVERDRVEDAETVLIFENDPKQAEAYAALFQTRGYRPEIALPTQDVQALCERLKPSLVVFDMGFWESDAAYVLGIVTMALGFERPVIVALASLPHQVRRGKRFGADAVWIRGVDDALGLPQLASDLLQRRREGKLKSRTPTTPL